MSLQNQSNNLSVKTMPKVRKPKFNFGVKIPNHWLAGNPIGTHLANAMHVIFPDGERFFIRQVQRHADKIADPALQERVKAFIAQEGIHGSSHQKFWSALERNGYDISWFRGFVNRWLWKNEKGLSIEDLMDLFFGDKMGLAVTASLEHYTAMMAESGSIVPFEDKMPAELFQLMRWHAAEELEHKSVAFDVYQAAGGDYPTRVAAFIMASALLPVMVIIGMASFLAQDPEWTKIFAPTGNAPAAEIRKRWGRVFGRDIPAWFRPDFHPDQIDNSHIIREILDKYPRMDAVVS